MPKLFGWVNNFSDTFIQNSTFFDRIPSEPTHSYDTVHSYVDRIDGAGMCQLQQKITNFECIFFHLFQLTKLTKKKTKNDKFSPPLEPLNDPLEGSNISVAEEVFDEESFVHLVEGLEIKSELSLVHGIEAVQSQQSDSPLDSYDHDSYA